MKFPFFSRANCSLRPAGTAKQVLQEAKRKLQEQQRQLQDQQKELSGLYEYVRHAEEEALAHLEAQARLNATLEERNKALQAEQLKLHTVVQHAPVILFGFDAQGVLTVFEGKGVEMMGLKPEDRLWITLDHIRKLNPAAADELDRAWAGETFHTVRQNQDGQYYETYFIPIIEEGKVQGITGVSINITQRHLTLQALRQQQAELEETTASLQVANRELEQSRQEALQALALADAASKAKSEFLANMSHELRTPLIGVIGYAELLQEYADIPEVHKEKIRIMSQSGEHLLHLINSLLDLAKIEAGNVELDLGKVVLPQLLAVVQPLFQLRTQQKGLVFEVQLAQQVPTNVLADEKKLRQCLINLLGNALKFTQAGVIRLLVDLDEQGRVRFTVTDTGIGIPEDKLKLVLEPFQQVAGGERRSLAEQGTGLGLAITNRLVTVMGGKLCVASQVGKGSTFYFALPLAAVTPTVPLAGLQAAPIVGYEAAYPIKILIVDDSQLNLHLARSILGKLEFITELATNGQEAVVVANRFRPHLILMDIRMPVMSGLEAIHPIRKLFSADKQPKVVAITASALLQEQQEVYQEGFDDFLAKPYTPRDLLQVVGRNLQLRYRTQHST